jgi:hypothetical protein
LIMPPDDKKIETPATAPASASESPAATSAPAAAPAAASPQEQTSSPADAPGATIPAAKPSLLQETVAAIEAKDKPPAEVKPAETKPAETKAEAAKSEAAKPETKPAEAAKPEEKKPEVKAEEKPAEAKATETKPAEAAKPAPVEYKYTLPETLKLDDAAKTNLHAAFDKFRENPAEGAQGLIDLHNKSLETFAKEVADNQRKVFYETRDGWRKEIMADPILGGSGHQTTAGVVARMRDLLVPKEMLAPRKFDDGSPRLSAFDEFLETTGAGDHPALWHLLHNAGRYLDEPAPPPPNARPTADNGRRGKTKMRDMYDHPRSNNGQS